jgi:hypothetical protein
VNNEEVYKMANVMADCGGLQVCLDDTLAWMLGFIWA